jgi:Protein of unknown function (DUF2510)
LSSENTQRESPIVYTQLVSEVTDSAPPGWYPKPTNPSQEGYWDGSAWTDNVRDLHSAQKMLMKETPSKGRKGGFRIILMPKDGYFFYPGQVVTTAISVLIWDIAFLVSGLLFVWEESIALVLLSLVAMWRGSRIRSIEKPEGFCLVRFWSSRLLKWNDIVAFELRHASLTGSGFYGVFANLVNGEQVRVPGVGFRGNSSGIREYRRYQLNPRTSTDPNTLLQTFNDLVNKHHDGSYEPPLVLLKPRPQPLYNWYWRGWLVFTLVAVIVTIARPELVDAIVAVISVVILTLGWCKIMFN